MDLPVAPRDVVLGPGYGVELQVSHVTFSSGFILITVLGVLIGLILVVSMILIAFFFTPNTPLPPVVQESIDTFDDVSETTADVANPGAAMFRHSTVAEASSVNSNLSQGVVQNEISSCPPGRYGLDCHHHKHDNQYQNIGHVSDPAQLEIIKQVNASDRSFSEFSCTKYCDADPECLGVYHENETCLLLKSVTLDTLPTGGHGGNLLTKKNVSNQLPIKFTDRVWFGGSDDRFGPRYWLNPKLDVVRVSQAIQLSTVPIQARLHGRTGYFSCYSFRDLDEWTELAEGYRHKTSEENLQLPRWWNQVWVLVL